MSDFFGKLKSGTEKMAFEADKMMRLNKAKGEVEKVKALIQAQYLKLGEMHYTQRATGGVVGSVYEEICQAIVDLEHQVEAKVAEVQKISAEGTQPAPVQPPIPPAPAQAAPPPPAQAAAATKFCPNCGKAVAASVKFCPDCGTGL